MALDPQIPLSVAQQPSYAKQAGEVYQLAGAIEKQQEYQQEKQDQQILQEGLKQEGINMTTSEGLMKLADWSKEHGVSVKSQGMVGQAISDSRKQDLEMRHLLAQQSLDNNKIGAEKKAEIGDQLSPIWDQWKQDKDTVGEEAANVNLQKNLQPAIEKIATKVDASGKPYYDANAVKQLSGVSNGKALESELNRIDSFRKTQQEIYETQLTQQKIAESKKRELFIGKAKTGGAGTIPENINQSNLHGQEFLDLLQPGEAADVLAVAEGRKSMSDIPVKDGRKARIGQYVTQFDPGFSNIRNPADKAAAVAISKDLSAIRPYIDMLDKNAEIAVDLSKKVIATDSRLLNKNINWLKQNMGDNPDVAEFLAQTTFVQTEAARVLNNPRLVGQLTDTARQEMEHVISGDMPLKSYERVIRRIQQDGQNRFQAMENQRNRLFGASIGPKEVPQSELTNTGKSTEVPHGAAPPAKNKQGWMLHKDAKGNMAYVGPKGEVEEVK